TGAVVRRSRRPAPARLGPTPFLYRSRHHPALHSFPTRRSSDLYGSEPISSVSLGTFPDWLSVTEDFSQLPYSLEEIFGDAQPIRSEEHTSELQSRENLVCRLLLEKKKKSQLDISLAV